MKKILIIILLAAAGMMAYNTNPDKEDHIIAIDTGMMEIIDEEVDTAFREIAKIIIARNAHPHSRKIPAVQL